MKNYLEIKWGEEADDPDICPYCGCDVAYHYGMCAAERKAKGL